MCVEEFCFSNCRAFHFPLEFKGYQTMCIKLIIDLLSKKSFVLAEFSTKESSLELENYFYS